jgi:biotin synthase
MALTRINLPNINIPATTAMETIISNGRLIALQSGANVVMLNITPEINKKQYEIYPNKTSLDHNIIKKQLISNGWHIEMNRGNSLKWEKENIKED